MTVMITEDYVSFEIAKLLKEKGFDAEQVSEFGGYYVDYYHNEQYIGIATESMMLNKTLEDWEYLRPTLQMAMKWLQESFNIIITPDYEYECTSTPWCYKIFKLGENGKPERVAVRGVSYDKDNNPTEHIVCYRDYERSYKDYTTKEEAVEEGIKYCLKSLI